MKIKWHGYATTLRHTRHHPVEASTAERRLQRHKSELPPRLNVG